MLDEIERPQDMTVDDWNEVYAQVQQELHQCIAKMLIQESQSEMQGEYDERMSEMEAEALAECADPNNN